MRHETKIAIGDWICGLLIGLMPFLAHALFRIAARPVPDWDDNWAADLLFISISTSGLSAVVAIGRLITGEYGFRREGSLFKIIMALNLIIFGFAGTLYGAVVTGRANDNTSTTALVFMVLSAVFSLNFEISLANRRIRPIS